MSFRFTRRFSLWRRARLNRDDLRLRPIAAGREALIRLVATSEKRRVKRNDIWSVETRRTERETRLNDWDPLQPRRS